MISLKIITALKSFYGIVQDKNIDRILSWSVSLSIQWVDIEPNEDIDILTDRIWAEKLDKLLQSFVVKPLQYSWTEKYRSYFGIYKIDGIQVEIMGEMQYRLRDNSWSTPNQSHEVQIFEYENMSLPVLSLQQEFQEYENMGREDKAKKIQERLLHN